MGILVLVLLVAAWGLVLGPALLRSTQDPSPLRTEKMFRRALKAIGGQRRPREVVGGRSVLVPPKYDYPMRAPSSGGGYRSSPGSRRRTAAERRRRNLSYLAAFIIVTFLLGLVPALHFLLFVNIVACALLLAYLAAAMYVAAQSDTGPEREPQTRAAPQPPRVGPAEAAGGWYGSGA